MKKWPQNVWPKRPCTSHNILIYTQQGDVPSAPYWLLGYTQQGDVPSAPYWLLGYSLDHYHILRNPPRHMIIMFANVNNKLFIKIKRTIKYLLLEQWWTPP